MAKIFTTRNVAIGAASLGGIVLLSRTRTAQKFDPLQGTDSKPLETNAVANVTKRFSAAGGSENGTPAIASTLGNSEQQGSNYEHGKGAGGVGLNSTRVKEGEKQKQKQDEDQESKSGGSGYRGEGMNKETGSKPGGDNGKEVNEATSAAKGSRRSQHGNPAEIPKAAAG